MRYIRLDGKQMQSKEAMHNYLADKLSLADYYGRNLDALNDCLGDIQQPTIIILDHSQDLIKELGKYGQNLITVFTESSKNNRYIRVIIRL